MALCKRQVRLDKEYEKDIKTSLRSRSTPVKHFAAIVISNKKKASHTKNSDIALNRFFWPQ